MVCFIGDRNDRLCVEMGMDRKAHGMAVYNIGALEGNIHAPFHGVVREMACLRVLQSVHCQPRHSGESRNPAAHNWIPGQARNDEVFCYSLQLTCITQGAPQGHFFVMH